MLNALLSEPRDYRCICHGCGGIHEVRARLLASPIGLAFMMPDGSTLILQAHACSDCETKEQHRIAEAFAFGVSELAYNYAVGKLGALPSEPKTVNLHKLWDIATLTVTGPSSR